MKYIIQHLFHANYIKYLISVSLPFTAYSALWSTFSQNLDFNFKKGLYKINSYERCDCEKEPIFGYILNIDKRKSASKG